MRLSRVIGLIIVLTLVSSALPQVSFAQGFNLDARRIGLGGAGNTNNIASKVIAEHQPYRVIPIPLGIFQLLDNRRFFDPDDPEFDPARAIEYAGNPMHFTLDRNSGSAGHRFMNDLVNAGFSRDLNAYRGFAPSPEIKAGGLFSPSWGKTFRVSGDASSGKSHGIFVGAGPYVSLGTALAVDPNLIELLASPVDVYRPNTQFLTQDVSTGQAAFAITGGYRGRFALSGISSTSSSRETGLHVAANYNYLRGFHYESADVQFRFDTDGAGLVTLLPSTNPVVVNRATSNTGNGFSLDLAAAVVTEKWDVGFGVDGIGNRINWKDLSSRHTFFKICFLAAISSPLLDRPFPRSAVWSCRYDSPEAAPTIRTGGLLLLKWDAICRNAWTSIRVWNTGSDRWPSGVERGMRMNAGTVRRASASTLQVSSGLMLPHFRTAQTLRGIEDPHSLFP